MGVRTQVGHSFIKQMMAETDAVFGGEHSGHYYFRENYRADSGIIAALVVLELLSVTGKPLSELLKPYQRYSASGEINAKVADPAGAVEVAGQRYTGKNIVLGTGSYARSLPGLEIGGRVDVHVAVAVAVEDDRNSGVLEH